MIEHKIKKVLPIEGPIGMDLLIKLNFETESDERLTLILTRTAAGALRDAYCVASDSLPPKNKNNDQKA